VIAALFVARGGAYYGLPDVDPWDIERDARAYAGPWPVVAHPPCARWCRLAPMVQAIYPHCRQGDDGGTFASALAAVRRWGGVLEHPAWSRAWATHGLLSPPAAGGWVRAIGDAGWVCHVEQGSYGHPARKATWLYAVGCKLPSLRWGCTAAPEATVSYCANKVPRRMVGRVRGQDVSALYDSDARPRLSSSAASSTPTEFRDLLLSMARSVKYRGGG
jgi:hypothetical protein